MIDFFVRGTPKSQQSRSKSARKRWQEDVRRAVPAESALLSGLLRLRIDFFFNGSTNVDTDNIIKPIQDALKHYLYDDDDTVVDVCARKIDLHHLPSLIGAPTTLLAALAQSPSDFVFIQVALADGRLTFS